MKHNDELALQASEEAAKLVYAAQQEEFDDSLMQTPILKVGQALTREVTEGEAAAGEFINTLTNEGIGDTVEFILSFFNKGRFASDKKTKRAFVASTSEIPDAWEPLVGAQYIGTPFTEYPEAEEQFKAAVNAKEREWESGPLVSTTYNFTGYVVVDNDGETDYQPVRLSLKRTDVPAARKISTLYKTKLRKAAWDGVFRLKTAKKEWDQGTSYVIDPLSIKLVRETTPEEKQLGSELAIAVMGGRTQAVGDENDAPAEPKDTGGISV